MKNRETLSNRQAGVVLIVSMVMLILLTLIGLTGSQVTSLEEKMAGNARDQNIAFQVAESTLIAAEQFVLSPANPPDNTTYNEANGLLTQFTADPDYFLAATWTNANSASTLNFGNNFINNATANVAVTNPRYIIKRINQFPDRTVFRITARAVGHNPGTQVILQEIFERPN